MISGFVGGHIVDPIEPNLILPEVKEPKNWWGGHMAIDKEKRFTSTFQPFWSLTFGTTQNLRALRSFALMTISSIQNGKERLVGTIRTSPAQGRKLGNTCGNTKARTT